MAVRPAKSKISLGICPVWSESLLCAQRVAKDQSPLLADSEDSGWMPRLIWVFAGRTLILLVLSCHSSCIFNVLGFIPVPSHPRLLKLSLKCPLCDVSRLLNLTVYTAGAGQNQQNDLCAQQRLRYGPSSSVGCTSAWHVDCRGFDPRGQQYSLVEVGDGIISTAILPRSLVQGGQLSVTGERMCT